MALVQHATGSLFDETSLRAYYKLENANDSGPNSNNLTNSNTVTFVSGGVFSKYANFVAASSQTLYTATKWLTNYVSNHFLS